MLDQILQQTTFQTLGITQHIMDVSGYQTFTPLTFRHAVAGTLLWAAAQTLFKCNRAPRCTQMDQDLLQVSLVFT